MDRHHLGGLAAGLCVAALTLSAAARAEAPAAPSAAPPAAARMQGDSEPAWINDPHMHAFYNTTVAAFSKGPAKVDVAGYQQKAFAIFRDFGPAMGMTPDQMQDHLKLIPRQVVQIVKDDPKVLDSYQNFVDATFGPR
jgi:hypothetical protein